MCSPNCIAFVERVVTSHDVTDKRVIEVGSYDVNGSARQSIEALRPASYIGVDIISGPGVDFVCDAADLLDNFEPGSFDVVISTEMVEHARDWRTVFTNLKRLCAPGGLVIITTRSPGFGYHGYPSDFWRYEESDMQLIFADYAIEFLEPDDIYPGVFVMARKSSAPEIDLSPIALTSIISGDRRANLSDREIQRGLRRLRAWSTAHWITGRLPKGVRAELIRRRILRGTSAERRRAIDMAYGRTGESV
jgi:SAM-dependent methyltransferase